MQLYHVWNNILETVTVIEENIAPGASAPTYLVRYENGRKARVSRSMFHKTRQKAWQVYVTMLIEAIKNMKQEIKKQQDKLSLWETELKQATIEAAK